MVKDIILDLFSEFSRGTLDVSRLNYGIISLIPKVPGATDIRQFRHIDVYYTTFFLWTLLGLQVQRFVGQ